MDFKTGNQKHEPKSLRNGSLVNDHLFFNAVSPFLGWVPPPTILFHEKNIINASTVPSVYMCV